MKSITSRVATTILVICAVIITALLVRREFFLSEVSASEPIPVRHLSDSTWNKIIGRDLILGSHTAKIKIVEFYDYECPFCRSIQPALNEILRKYPNDVAIIHRHFPLPYHSTAYSSAIAVECASEQNQFEAYHAALFERQRLSASLNWTELARIVGIPDLPRFQECVEAEIHSDKIKRDMRLAESLQINAIPTLIVEGVVFEGVLTVNELDKIIQDVTQLDRD